MAEAQTEPLSRRRVMALAWPIVVAQAATAATGVVDTAVMGRVGDKADLAAVGVAAVTFSFVYWAFGFLRMSTTGLVAQAEGAGDHAAARAHLVRALLLAAGLGLVLLLLGGPIEVGARASFDAAADVEALAGEYIAARIWGAPAALTGYAVTGWLLGVGRTRSLLLYQLVLGATNAGLDVYLAGVLDWGPAGIGAGTAIAEWVALGFGLVLVAPGLRRPGPPAGHRKSRSRPQSGRGRPLFRTSVKTRGRTSDSSDVVLWDGAALRSLVSANRDILVRTLALLLSFAWFVNAGAKVGTAAVAGNEVLLQFIAVAAFVLDAFAFVAEREVGAAYGARDRSRFRRAMRLTSELALIGGAAISLLLLATGPAIIDVFVVDPEARAVAQRFLPWCALVPLLGVPAWQLDGAFLGATRGRALRNAALLATASYIALDLVLAPRYGNAGVWTAFVLSYIARAAALGIYVPGLVRSVGSSAGTAAPE